MTEKSQQASVTLYKSRVSKMVAEMAFQMRALDIQTGTGKLRPNAEFIRLAAFQLGVRSYEFAFNEAQRLLIKRIG